MTPPGQARAAAPWYRQVWPWLLILPPAVAVIGGIATITLAVRSSDGMVAADYYKRGLAINEQLARSQRAQALGLQGTLTARGIGAGDSVQVQLSSREAMPPDAAIKLRLVHPGRSGADREAVLARVSVSADGRSATFVGEWNASAPMPAPVSWRMVIEARDWRIDGDASQMHERRHLQFGSRP